MATTNRVQAITKLFQGCRYEHDLYTVFSDWCECAAISLRNGADLNGREDREARYLEMVRKYDKTTIETFPQILGEVIQALEEAPQDILGQVFHALELHNAARGQRVLTTKVSRPFAQNCSCFHRTGNSDSKPVFHSCGNPRPFGQGD